MLGTALYYHCCYAVVAVEGRSRRRSVAVGRAITRSVGVSTPLITRITILAYSSSSCCCSVDVGEQTPDSREHTAQNNRTFAVKGAFVRSILRPSRVLFLLEKCIAFYFFVSIFLYERIEIISSTKTSLPTSRSAGGPFYCSLPAFGGHAGFVELCIGTTTSSHLSTH